MPKIPWAILPLLLTITGTLDQTTRAMDRTGVSKDFNGDREFVSQIENSVPRNSRVFQLPYFAYPEAEPIVQLGGYEHFKGYLHSKSLSWSTGAMNGRKTNEQLQKIAAMAPQDMVGALKKLGFCGVWIDRRGYPDGGLKFVSELRPFLPARNGLISADQMRTFFYLDEGPK